MAKDKNNIDFGDKKSVKNRKGKVDLADLEWKEALKAMLSTPSGVVVLRKILTKSKMFAPNLYAGSTNDTIYRLGQRDIGIWLFSEMEAADINLLRKFITEDKNE